MPKLLIFIVVVLLLAGCATNGQSVPLIERISEEELSRILPQPLATLSLDDLVRLSTEGMTAAQIIEQIKSSNSMYDLTPSQSVLLSKKGVDSQILDYIHTSRELAVRNSIADEINKREKIKRVELESLKRQQLRAYDPFCRNGPYGVYPYGQYGSHFGIGYARPWGCW
ncbi:MAG: hypothetical protein WCG46_03230 [Methylophilaceae bacterium]